jgi:selenocysteine lyase/cysteine desulfurase
VGALLARKDSVRKLSRHWFAGGTTTVASVRGNKYYPAEAPARFEDGTLDYLNIPAVEIGCATCKKNGYETIHERVRCLTGWLLQELTALRHAKGRNWCRFTPPSPPGARRHACLNFLDSNGKLIEKKRLETAANQRRIPSVWGSSANPGAGEVALDISGDELSSCFSRPQLRAAHFRLGFPALHRPQGYRRGARFCGFGQQFQRRADFPGIRPIVSGVIFRSYNYALVKSNLNL